MVGGYLGKTHTERWWTAHSIRDMEVCRDTMLCFDFIHTRRSRRRCLRGSGPRASPRCVIQGLGFRVYGAGPKSFAEVCGLGFGVLERGRGSAD
jgi:hypothetical protein